MDETLRQYQNRYQQLRALLQSGRISQPQFEAEVVQLRWADSSGTWWMLDASSGLPLRWDGAGWSPAQYPGSPGVSQGAPPAAAGVPVRTGAPTGDGMKQRAQGLRAMVAATPILALVPSVACGGLWFLYTFIGLFKSEGLAGLDLGTPLIVIGLPLIFWFLKKPIDQLLLPLKPAITRIPRPTRLGISLAIPILLSCGCSLTASSGYQALNMASLVSILAAAIMMRY